MPRGVYPRTKNQLRAAVANLAKGREKEAREKANKKLKENAKNPAWRFKVSQATKKAMWRSEVRARHLAGLQKAFERYGVNFKGGNGQEPVETVKRLSIILEPQGFIREYTIPTRFGHNTPGIPNNYKVDFGNPETKIAIEVDGPSHHGRGQQELDKKKTKILELLGWKVLRYKH